MMHTDFDFEIPKNEKKEQQINKKLKLIRLHNKRTLKTATPEIDHLSLKKCII